MRRKPDRYWRDKKIDKTRPIFTPTGQDISFPNGIRNGSVIRKSYETEINALEFDSSGRYVNPLAVAKQKFENDVRQDYKQISEYFKDSTLAYFQQGKPIPKLVIIYGKSQSTYNIPANVITVSVSPNESTRDTRDEIRNTLIHEYLHYLGKRHSEGYGSRTNLDSLSPSLRKLIFKESEPVSFDRAKSIGEHIGINWKEVSFTPDDFRKGLNVELEHGIRDPITDVTTNDPIITGKIALAHLKESPQYYNKLEKMEKSLQPNEISNLPSKEGLSIPEYSNRYFKEKYGFLYGTSHDGERVLTPDQEKLFHARELPHTHVYRAKTGKIYTVRVDV